MIERARGGAARRRSGERPGLAMKELSRATGLPRSTLLHYTAAGLLPPPVRTSRNMAWYDPACVDRVRLVRQLQKNHRLALHEIRALLASGDPRALAGRLAVNEAVFGAAGPALETLDPGAFTAGTGLAPDQVAALARLGLLVPLEEGRFDAADVAAGRAFARALGWGLAPEDFAFYARAAAQVVDAEVALRARLNAALSEADDAARTLEMLGNARALRAYVVERTFQRRIAGMKHFQEGGATPEHGRPRRRTP
jgi:DNA-binding transcriptional MerR regulator